MAETEPPLADADNEESGGVVHQARAFLAACAQAIAVRLRLISMESQEAFAHLLKIFILAGIALIFGVFAWVFACLAVVFLLARAFGGGGAWIWASLAMAGAHLLGAFLLGWGLKSKVKTKLFPLTAEEFQQDRIWLEKQNPTKPRS